MEHLTVELGERSYPIRIGSELLESLIEAVHLNQERRGGRSCALAVDASVAEHYGEMLASAFPSVPMWKMPPGETSKSLARAEELLSFFSESGLDRGSFLVAVGGGVLGDLSGFCASVFLRGIEYFHIPTTLLAMVDSSVGGKTGVNLPNGKNLVGTFLQPQGVAVWMPFLETLPPREFSAGMAEVIKYGLLGDEDLFHLLEKSGPLSGASPVMETIVTRCCRIKAQIVADDEKEEARNGGRALLNLGHTFAHAIEAVAGYDTYLHGEAVAVGLLMAARFSTENGFLKSGAKERIERVVADNGLPLQLQAPLPIDDLLTAMTRDKKVRNGKLRLVLLDQIGMARTHEIADFYHLRELWAAFGAQ